MKRFSMLLVALLMLVSSMASANPFSDVPTSHWANEAITKLANKGILTGYPDGTYQGNNNVSRYALAMTTAKMLANIEQMADNGMDFGSIGREDLQTLEKLTVEFADELALLGVKVTALEDDMEMVKSDLATVKTDVSKMKACVENGGTEKIKISGDFLVRQTNAREKNDADPNNSYAETQFRLMFKANVDENVTAVARWIVLDDGSNAKNAPAANYYFGKNLGGSTVADNQIDLAYLSIKDMFSFGGDFTFGRNFRTHGHALVMSNYVDAITYTKRAGEIDMNLNSIYNRINGVDFRQIWNLNLDTKYRDNDIYVGYYTQSYGDGLSAIDGLPYTDGAANVLEFGASGALGDSGHYSYDLGFAYNQTDKVLTSTKEYKGWTNYAAIKWDGKKEWAAKVAYLEADEEAYSAISLNNNLRYSDGIETPYEDIARGNNFFNNGFTNMSDIKVQVEYRPCNDKHYARIAYDMLDKSKDSSNNDNFTVFAIAAGDPAVKDAAANVMTLEYRYRLTENTRVRVGYTDFEFDGKYTTGVKTGVNNAGGTGLADYGILWAEVYSRF